jgi:uncharacterized protein YecA (UPF0149 family)
MNETRNKIKPTSNSYPPYKSTYNSQIAVKELKVGRNDPCTCGSGKK